MKNSGWKYWKNTNNEYHSYLKKFLFIVIIGWFLFVPAEAVYSRKTSIPEIKKDILELKNQNQLEHDQTIYVMDGDKAIDKNIYRDQYIEEKILEGIKKNPFIVSKAITVTVQNGGATLKGTVNDLTEGAAATADAFQGGAVKIKNDLKIRGSPDLVIKKVLIYILKRVF